MLTRTAPTPATPALAGLPGPAPTDGGSATEGSDAQAFAQALDAAAQADGSTTGPATEPAADRPTTRPTARPGAARGHAQPGDGLDALADERRDAGSAAAAPAGALAADAADTEPAGTAAKAGTASADDEHDDIAGSGNDLLAWLATLSLTPPAPSAATATAGLAPPSDAAASDAVSGPGRRVPAWAGRGAADSDENVGDSDDTTAVSAGSDGRTDAAAGTERAAPALPAGAEPAAGGRPTPARTAAATDSALADTGSAGGMAAATAAGRITERMAAGMRAERHADAAASGRAAVEATQAAAPTADPLPTLPSAWTGIVAPHAAHQAPPLQAELRAPLASKEFAPALGAQMSVLVRDGIEHAQLKLNPAEMGPIEVRISVDGSQAQVDFSAAHAQTRQALQDAVPALATALREQGLTLTGGGVFEQPREQRGDAAAAEARLAHGGPERSGAEEALPGGAAPRLPRPRGVLDMYA